MKKIAMAILIGALFCGQALAADYMSPEEIERIWGDGSDAPIDYKVQPGSMDALDVMEDYAEAAAFIQGLQYLEPDTNFGGMMEAEHLLDIIQTDNTSEAVWIWCRYYELTGDNQYYQNVLNAWEYINNWPAWREEGGSNPSNGYYRYYVGGWGLLAEMIYRDVYGSDTFRVYADSVADYMVNHYLNLGMTNVMCYAWALGCLYQYGLDVGNQDYVTYADTMSAQIKEWIEVAPSFRINREVWAMSGGALVWGLANSYFQAHPENYYQWMLDNGQYLDVIDTLGDWHIAHNAWYAIGHWTVFKATGDSTYYYNHAFLTDTLLVQDTDEDGGIPAEFTDTADMDQSWCTAYLGFMCLNPLISEMTGIAGDKGLIPDDYVLVRNYPNPFNSSTKIEYSGFPKGKLQVDIYDIMGRRVDRIYDRYTTGSGLIDWNAGGIASGIYFVRLHGLGVSGITRAVLVK